jgi:hypothetical protein
VTTGHLLVKYTHIPYKNDNITNLLTIFLGIESGETLCQRRLCCHWALIQLFHKSDPHFIGFDITNSNGIVL